jgi:hypothetical protein
MSGPDNRQGASAGQAEVVNKSSADDPQVSPTNPKVPKDRGQRLALIALQLQLGFISQRNLAVVAEVSRNTVARWNLATFQPGTKAGYIKAEDAMAFFQAGGPPPKPTKRKGKAK